MRAGINNFYYAACQNCDYNSLLAKVDPHGGDELGVEYSIGVLVQEAGLAHARVT